MDLKPLIIKKKKKKESGCLKNLVEKGQLWLTGILVGKIVIDHVKSYRVCMCS